ncbi:MAG: hypothetical protein J6T43_12295 [Prevotella sp.]|nr:hypothetical protein [Prevotella sp.]
MKKKLFIPLFLLAMASCSQSEISSSDRSINDIVQVSDYKYLGDLHNAFMSNAKSNFSYIDDSYSTLSVDEKEELVFRFNYDFALTLKEQMPNMTTDELYRSLSYYKEFSNYKKIKSLLAVEIAETKAGELTNCDISSILSDSIIGLEALPNIKVLTDLAYNQTVITPDAYICLEKVITLLDKSNKGLISDAQYGTELNIIIDDINKAKYKVGDPTIETTGPILAIIQSSYEWWEENPDAAEASNKIPQVVALDAAGAVIGAVGSLMLQEGNVPDWGKAGKSALWGAASASCGAVGKLARLFK